MSRHWESPNMIRAKHSDPVYQARTGFRFQESLLRAMYDNAGVTHDVKLYGHPNKAGKLCTEPIYAHKIILAHASKHLFDLFGNTDSTITEHVLEGVDHGALRRIVEFIYTDTITVKTEEDVDDWLEVAKGADFLTMETVSGICDNYLIDRVVCVDNCVALWSFSRKYNRLRLTEVTSAVVAREVKLLARDADFLALSFVDCCKLLMCEAVIYADGDARCAAALSWLSHDKEGRATHARDIMNVVPLLPGCLSIDTILVAGKVIREYDDVLFAVMTGALERVTQRKPVVDRNHSSSSRQKWWVFSGEDNGFDYYNYDVKKRLWSGATEIPCGQRYRANGCAVVRDIAVFPGGGGYSCQGGEVHEYNLSTNIWFLRKAKLRGIRSNSAACSDGEYAYAIGGESYINDDCRLTDLVERYDPVSNEVVQMASMLSGRMFPATVFHSTTHAIYLAGGCTNQSLNASYSAYLTGEIEDLQLPNTVERYDVWSNSWAKAGTLNEARLKPGLAFCGNDLFVVGGQTNANRSDCVEIFDVATGKSRFGPPLLKPRPVCVAVGLDDDRVICALGGGHASVECYDIREGKWTTGLKVPDMPQENSDFAFASV